MNLLIDLWTRSSSDWTPFFKLYFNVVWTFRAMFGKDIDWVLASLNEAMIEDGKYNIVAISFCSEHVEPPHLFMH